MSALRGRIVKAVIVNGAREKETLLDEVQEALVRKLSDLGWAAECLPLRAMEIADCIGCWVRTPGECHFDDAGRRVARSAIESDLLVYRGGAPGDRVEPIFRAGDEPPKPRL